MKSLWTDESVSEATGGTAGGGSWAAKRVEIDSRRVREGDLFVAIKGERFDGHEFVADAMAHMASAALVSRKPLMLPAHAPLVTVPDTLKGLEALARYNRARSRARIVGVTGSVGKTSAKEMLRLALSAHGDVFASSGNFNNHIGTPLNLANLPPDTPNAVFEMGMNHAGEIRHLTGFVHPHVAVITNVEAVHLEFFKSVEDIADAKAEIFEGVDPGGTAVLNADNAHFAQLAAAAKKRGLKVVSCGSANADCRIVEYKATPEGSAVRININGKELAYTLAATGRHWAMTSALALAAVQALGLDVSLSARALAAFMEPEGRGRPLVVTVAGTPITLIDDSYNASPAAMQAAFTKTHELWAARGKKGRKIAALGDMLELGKNAYALHEGLKDALVQHGFDEVSTAGKHMHSLHEALPRAMRGEHASAAMELLPVLRKTLREGDILLIKGSHGSKMYELAHALMQGSPQEKKHAL
jgi:UDP-N-acetylmuramoyl-tripeptide--D-alanyl-D-alanine ligase